MAQPPTVSIALATYNGARFLREQLASFTAQTRLPDELVVGDDGSNDETVALLEAFAVTAPFPVRITRNPENYGYSRNFCETVQRCAGDVIFLSDQDDVWYPEKIERCLAEFAADAGCLLVTHDAQLTDSALNPGEATLGEQIAAAGGDPQRELMHGCCIAMRSWLADFLRPPPDRWHDVCLVRVGDLLQGHRYVAQPLISYRRHDAAESASHLTALRRALPWSRLTTRWRDARRTDPVAAVAWSISEQLRVIAAFERNRSIIVREAGLAVWSEGQTRLACELDQLLRRQKVQLQRWPLRPFAIAAFACSGGYRGTATRWSMFRDLLA